MNSARELFQSNTDLISWLKPIIVSERWAQTVMYARAHIMTSKPTPAQLEGVIMMEDALLALAEPDSQPSVRPKSGLNHDIDNLPRGAAPKATPKPLQAQHAPPAIGLPSAVTGKKKK